MIANEKYQHELLKIYQHHIMQFDRLMHAIDTLKQENKLLRAMLKNHTGCLGESETALGVDQVSGLKPRVTCRPF